MDNQQPISKFYDPDTLDDLITVHLNFGRMKPQMHMMQVYLVFQIAILLILCGLRRQTFCGGSYSFINTKTLDPFPDYWLSFLYKTLVGSRVLEVNDGISLGIPTTHQRGQDMIPEV